MFSLQNLQITTLLVGSLSFAQINAAEQHDGDFQPYLSGGKVQLNTTLIEADFGDLPGGLYQTKNPGFDADEAKGAFGAGNWLQFQGLSALKFWDGTTWTANVPNGEYVQIEDALGNLTTFTANTVINPIGVVGAFSANSDLHEHLNFSIRNSSNALGASVGAYWIELNLFDTLPNGTNPISIPSDAASIVFNRGLTTAAYEAAVSGVAAVPVPAAVWMFGSGLLAWLGVERRKMLAGQA